MIRDVFTPGADNRVAMLPGVSKSFGTPRSYPDEGFVDLGVLSGWLIREESGVLMFRSSSAPDYRYAFYPGSSVRMLPAIPLCPGASGSKELMRGVRWVIRQESGALVFRDLKSSGDYRYAFWPCSGKVDL